MSYEDEVRKYVLIANQIHRATRMRVGEKYRGLPDWSIHDSAWRSEQLMRLAKLQKKEKVTDAQSADIFGKAFRETTAMLEEAEKRGESG